MSHPLLDIENWEKINVIGELNISNDKSKRVQFTGLKINVPKFYFYLKEKFGPPNVDFNSLSQFFQERDIAVGKVWCFIFRVDSSFILISGDSHINIAVLPLIEPQEKIDFDIFCTNINKEIESKSLEKYKLNCFDIYVNYSFFLENLINKFKALVIDEKTPIAPPTLYLHPSDFDKPDNDINYKIFEYRHEYNNWLSVVLERATVTLQIQILLPIYFESLVDLAFRIKLKKSNFNYEKKYEIRKRKVDIFKYFEQLPLHVKIKTITEKCFDVDINKANSLLKLINSYSAIEKRKKRNKLLHGNSLNKASLNSTPSIFMTKVKISP